LRVENGEFIRSAVSGKDFLHDALPQIAFAGRSNVGKSSLLNRLLGRKALARVSSSPGRTRAINYFLVNSNLYFVDLPGYGYAKVGKDMRRQWAKLMEQYFETTLAHVVQLVDAKVGATPLDVEAAAYFADTGAPTTVVATKIDRVPRSRRSRQLAGIRETLAMPEERVLVPFSSKSGDGLRELWREIDSAVASAGSLREGNEGIRE
jgi:GTP-binding protein